MLLIDTHSHLNFAAFNKDRDEVIKRCFNNNIWLINVGTNYETSKKAVEIAESYNEGVYAAIGLHPLDIAEEEFDYQKYKKLALSSKKVVAVGEIGLDYYWKPKTKKKLELFKQKQKELFLQELRFASELNLPVIFHCRMAHDDLIKTLTSFQVGNNCAMAQKLPRGVIHCFTGSWEQAQKYLDMGFYFGFNGIIFKFTPHQTGSGAGLNLDGLIKKTSLDRILIETDCPYLSPPNFGEERNNPLGVKYIAKKIARIKNISFEKVAEQTFQNSQKLFNIGT